MLQSKMCANERNLMPPSLKSCLLRETSLSWSCIITSLKRFILSQHYNYASWVYSIKRKFSFVNQFHIVWECMFVGFPFMICIFANLIVTLKSTVWNVTLLRVRHEIMAYALHSKPGHAHRIGYTAQNSHYPPSLWLQRCFTDTNEEVFQQSMLGNKLYV